MTRRFALCLLAVVVITGRPARVLSLAPQSGAPADAQAGPSMKEIEEWLKRDLRAAGSHDVSAQSRLGSSGDRYEIERIALSDCRLTVRQAGRHYGVINGERMEAPNRQIEGAIITLKDLDIRRLAARELLRPSANIPSYLVVLSAVADRGDPFTVESEGYQGGPKKGPDRVFRLRVGQRGAAEKAVEMIRRAAVLCGAPDVPLPTNSAATSATSTAPTSTASPNTAASAAASAPQPPAASAARMTNDQVIQMVAAGLSDQVVIMSIHQAAARAFDLSTAGLIGLKKAGVSDAVIAVMQAGGGPP